MSDSNKIDPVAGAASASPVRAAGVVPAVRPPSPPSPVAAAGGVRAVVAALDARLAAGQLDRPAAVRALVTEVVSRELGGLDPQMRAQMVDEVVAVLAEEPAWQARLDGLWTGGTPSP